MSYATGKITVIDYDALQLASGDDVLVCLNEQEILALLAISDVLSWSTRYHSLLGSVDPVWIREFAAKVREKLMCFGCCDTIADCILTSEAVRDAVDVVIVEDNADVEAGNNEAALPESVRQAPLIPEELVPGCEDDILWGACVATVDGVFEATKEVLELIYLATSPTDLVGEILEVIPIVGGFLDLVVGFTNWVSEHAYLLFQTFDSDVARDAFRCKLFCVALTGCNVSADDVWNVFYELSSQTGIDVTEPADVTIGKIIDIVLEGQVTEVVLGTLNLVGLTVLLHGGKFGRGVVGIRSLAQLAAIGAAKFASNLWEVQCDQCPDTERRLSGYGTAAVAAEFWQGTIAIYQPVEDRWDGGYHQSGGVWFAFGDVRWTMAATITRVAVKCSVHRTRSDGENLAVLQVDGVIVASHAIVETEEPVLFTLEASGVWPDATQIRVYFGVSCSAQGQGNLSVYRMEYDV